MLLATHPLSIDKGALLLFAVGVTAFGQQVMTPEVNSEC